MADDILLNLATDIVSAHVSNNAVTASDLPILIQAVYGSLAELGKAPEIVPVKLEPAVSVRSSVKPDALTCLECGAKVKTLKRHLGTRHGLTPSEYRGKWGLGPDYPMVSPNYSAKRSQLALSVGLGRKPGQTIKAKAPTAPAPAVEPKPRGRKKTPAAATAD